MRQSMRGVMGVGLALGVGALPAVAQGMALPGTNPVGIARSGVQVAYGYSLEAAALNPALLSSVRDKGGYYLAFGLESASAQESMESNQISTYSDDRNRKVGAFGFARHLSEKLTVGFKLDEPYALHRRFKDSAPSRYYGDGLDFAARRFEGQVALALSPNVSVGASFGMANLSFDASNVVRVGVPNSLSTGVDGLVEQRLAESGSKTVPSYSLGARWAINPRWTLGFAHQSGLKGDLDLKGGLRGAALGYLANDGLSVASLGTSARAATLLAASKVNPGVGSLELPAQTTLGVRHRPHPLLTLEFDARWTSGALQVPTFATLQTPTATVKAPAELPKGRGHAGWGVSGELELGKLWTVRAGLFLDQQGVAASTIEPLLGGARTAVFSTGVGYKIGGGELSLGYQYRQSEDMDTNKLNGVWSSTGFRDVGSRIRVEGMGHLVALGFRKNF